MSGSARSEVAVAASLPRGLTASDRRHVWTLYRALRLVPGALVPGQDAVRVYRALRSAVYAVLVGTQRRRHLEEALAAAVRAAARSIRRGAVR